MCTIQQYKYFMAKVQINDDLTKHLTEIIPASGQKGGLYLGNQIAATNMELLSKYKITSIITIAEQLDNKYPLHLSHKKINISDQPLENIAEYFQQSYKFIKKHIHQGNVFIHCKMGISRSATLVIAYIMRKYKYSYEKAFVKVKDRRSVINPNAGFVMQLKQYDKKIKELKAKLKS